MSSELNFLNSILKIEINEILRYWAEIWYTHKVNSSTYSIKCVIHSDPRKQQGEFIEQIFKHRN